MLSFITSSNITDMVSNQQQQFHQVCVMACMNNPVTKARLVSSSHLAVPEMKLLPDGSQEISNRSGPKDENMKVKKSEKHI